MHEKLWTSRTSLANKNKNTVEQVPSRLVLELKNMYYYLGLRLYRCFETDCGKLSGGDKESLIS